MRNELVTESKTEVIICGMAEQKTHPLFIGPAHIHGSFRVAMVMQVVNVIELQVVPIGVKIWLCQ